MSESEPEIPDLIAYALYDADERASQFELPLQIFLASLALYQSDVALSEAALFNAVCKLLPAPDISPDAFSRALSEALNRELLQRNESAELELSPDRAAELAAATDRLASQRAAFHAHLRESVEDAVGVALDDGAAATLGAEVERFVQRTFHDHSVELARAFGPGGHGLDASMKGFEERKLASLVNTLIPASKRLLRNQYQVGLRDGLLSLENGGRAHLAALHQKTVAFALLHQDPTVLRVKRELARRRVVYLDTNVLMAWMFDAHPRHAQAREVADLARSVECTLRVSKFTLEELDLQIKESDQKYRQISQHEGIHAVVDDDMVRSYRRAKDNQPALVWDAYLANFQPAKPWLEDHGVNIDGYQDWANAVQDDRKPDVFAAVQAYKKSGSNTHLIDFDVHNLLYVQLRRKTWPADAMGNRVWFVTLDRSLAKSEASLVHRSVYPVPSSHQADGWCEFLSLYAVPDSPEVDAYVSHLVQSQLGLLREDPQFVDTRFLITLEESGFDLEEVLTAGPDRARQILVRLQESREVRRLLGAEKQERELPAWGS